jgi:hypothetical protein
MLLVGALVFVSLIERGQAATLRCPTQSITADTLDGYEISEDALYSVWATSMPERDTVMEELASVGEGGNKIGVGAGFEQYGFVSRLTREELRTLMGDIRVTGIDYDYDLKPSSGEDAAPVPCVLDGCTSCLTGMLASICNEIFLF